MATLEKIRSKSVLLFVVIIVALLAFILGDFLTSGRSYFGNGTTMYQAGSQKVDHSDYEKVVSQNNNSGQDGDQMQQALMQGLMMRELMNEQYKLMGIDVTDAQVSEIMNNYRPLSPQYVQNLQAYGVPVTDRAGLLDAINNPSRYGIGPELQSALKEQWMAEEQDIEDGMKSSALYSLFDLFTANELDAKAEYDNAMVTLPISYVKTSVIGIPDEGIEVTDADLRAKWQEMRPMFDLAVYQDRSARPNWVRTQQGGMVDDRIVAINEPVKAIDYVVVDIVPSRADLMAASAEVSRVQKGLNEQNGIDAIAGTKFVSNSGTVTKADIAKDATLKRVPDSLVAAGKVANLGFNAQTKEHTLVKFLDSKSAVDSVKVSVLAVVPESADSIMGLIANGTSYEDLINAGTANGISEQWLRIGMNPNMLPGELSEKVVSAPINQNLTYSDTASVNKVTYIYNVGERKNPVNLYDVAVMTYTVDPSPQTISDLKMELNSFLASNSNAADFSAKADSLYRLQHGLVSASSASVGSVPGTRQAVKWAMDAKPGKVSRVFDTNKAYVAVAVTEAFEDNVPYNSPLIKEMLSAEVRKDKKAAQLIEKYKGSSSLDDYAKAMDATVLTDSTIVFGGGARTVAGSRGTNPVLLGQVASAQPGQLVGPFQNENDVIVFVASEPVKSERRPYDYDTDGQTFMRNFGLNFQEQRTISPTFFYMLVGDRKVKNNTADFVQIQD